MKMKFFAQWAGERAAGINPGSEEVTIELKYTSFIDEGMLEVFGQAVKDYFDGAHVTVLEPLKHKGRVI